MGSAVSILQNRMDDVPQSVRLIAGSALFVTVLVLLFACCDWADHSLRTGEGGPLWRYILGWGRGMAPWYLLTPIVYAYARRFANRGLLASAATALGTGVLAMTVIALYAALVLANQPGVSVIDILSGFQLTDWLWDVVLFLLVFSTGRHFKPAEHSFSANDNDAAPTLAVKSYDSVEYIPVADIQGATAQGNYIALHLPSREVLYRATMASLSETLSDSGFVRIHRSHLVNPDSVISAAARGGRVKEVHLSNGIKLPVSERYNDHVRDRLNGRVCG